MNDTELLNTLLDIAEKHLITGFPPATTHEKSAKELVTATDLVIEDALRTLLEQHRPQHAILGEERGETEGNEHTWILDPLDGTTNYAHALPYFTTAIALVHKNAPVLAGVVAPTLKKRYVADTTTTRNGEQLTTSQPPPLKEAFITFCHKNTPESIAAINARYTAFKTQARDFRRLGSANLEICNVAEGVLHGFIGHDLPPWDFVAGCHIAETAGCTVTTLSGEPWKDAKTTGVIVAHPTLHATLLHLWNA